jgi:hypothetical protein
MLKENNPLLKLELKEEKNKIIKILSFFEILYGIFDLILENPINNFWYEFIGITIGYFQIIMYLFDKTVSK